MHAITEVVYPSPGYSFCFQAARDRKLHFNWHHHTEYELAVCRNGSGEAHVGDVFHSFKGPAAFFISPGVNHSLVSKDNFDGWIIQIPPLIIDRYTGRPEFHFLSDLTARSIPALWSSEEVSAKIAAILERAEEKNGVFRWICLLEALYAASEDGKVRQFSFLQEGNLSPDGNRRRITEGNKKEEDNKFEIIVNNLFNQYAEPHNLADSAESAGMSIPRFCRKFRKATGMTFTAYINSMRINNAKKLLQQSKLYVDDISFECGFNSVSFFNRKFREQTGMTPMEYRRRFGAE
jgi:AraC-like DNA-binding protein